MARERKISNLYEKEDGFYKSTVEFAESEQEKGQEEWKEKYIELSNAYGTLLDEARIITSVSDRLQNKLNRTHNKLQEQSEEINKINTELAYNNDQLQRTVDELTKMKVSRKAATIVIVLAIILFLISEGVIEPFIEKNLVEQNTNQGQIIAFLLKGVIALLIKPIEIVVEKFMMRQRVKESNKKA